jgi:phosphoribosylanthranilate isomerase
MRVRIKICGLTTPAAAEAAAALGVDAVGFVFAQSPRRIEPDAARSLSARLSPFVTRVAVFRYPDPADVERVITAVAPQVIQTECSQEIEDTVARRAALLPVFHDGDDLVDRVTRYRDRSSSATTVLLEAPGRGGRGVAPDWSRAAQVARSVHLVLAGGLTPENVEDAIRAVHPYAVDVSSGVEAAPGEKDPRRMEQFVAAVRRAEQQLESTLEISS